MKIDVQCFQTVVFGVVTTPVDKFKKKTIHKGNLHANESRESDPVETEEHSFEKLYTRRGRSRRSQRRIRDETDSAKNVNSGRKTRK